MTGPAGPQVNEPPGQAIQVVPHAAIERAPELSVEAIVERVQKVQEVARQVMQEGHDFGKIPGVEKDVLFKPGAELLALTFRLDPQIAIQERIWHEDGHLTVVCCCTMYHSPTGARLGSGLGVCSTKESKYAWRKGERLCPKCSKPAIRKSNKEPGFYCWAKLDGCGAKFRDNDPSITGQQVGRVPNPDLADCYNTVVKMAAKRAQVAATLIVTCASRIFTQDQEDFVSDEEPEPPPRKPGSGAPVTTPSNISPHLDPDENPGDFNPTQEGDAVYAAAMTKMHKVKDDIMSCGDIDTALLIRAVLGSKAKSSQLTRELQTARETGLLSPDQRKELGSFWQQLNRMLEQKEAALEPGSAADFLGEHGS